MRLQVLTAKPTELTEDSIRKWLNSAVNQAKLFNVPLPESEILELYKTLKQLEELKPNFLTRYCEMAKEYYGLPFQVEWGGELATKEDLEGAEKVLERFYRQELPSSSLEKFEQLARINNISEDPMANLKKLKDKLLAATERERKAAPTRKELKKALAQKLKKLLPEQKQKKVAETTKRPIPKRRALPLPPVDLVEQLKRLTVDMQALANTLTF